DYALPGSESHRAAELLEEAGFDFRAGTQAQLVFRVDPGTDTPAFRDQVDALAERVGEAIPEARVVSPFAPEGSRQVSPDGTVASVAVALPTLPAEDLAEVQERLTEIRASQDTPAFEVGGVMVDQDAESRPP